MLSQTGRYALKALVYLARHGGDGYVLVKEISSSLDIPRQYLSKILHSLTRVGLLRSQRGRTGGFRLNRPAAEITLFEVIDPLDHLSRLSNCLMCDEPCDDNDPCGLHEMWGEVRGKYLDFLNTTTLEKLSSAS
ncbi:MAG: Rrf2 family transcriptional regulator [Candidatus Glassbacteria bacterium]|nr:Rrf2 family transcriptional regulator [Candidatus Glassbacteria bacterium]